MGLSVNCEECTKCGNGIEEGDDIYCASCFTAATEKLLELGGKEIKDLKAKASRVLARVDKLEIEAEELESEVAELGEAANKLKSFAEKSGKREVK